jgi:integrase
MRQRIVPLSDVQLKNAKPKAKDFKLSDGQGLYLLVRTTGGKLWRIDYSFAGKRSTLSLGAYPYITLAEARQRRDDAKKLLANGIDPGAVKKAQKAATVAIVANSFEVVAREWHDKFSVKWSQVHSETLMERLVRDVFPYLGKCDIAEINPPELLAVLRRVESRGALDTAHRIKYMCGQIFRYAVATGRAESDPSRDLQGALPPVKFGHRAAPTDPKEVAPLLRAIDDFKCSFPVKCALRLLPLVFCRPGELRAAEWSEFDLENERWDIPAHRMKMKEQHTVPLSRQVIAILKELQPLTGSGKYLFPSIRTTQRCMSDNTLNASYRRMGFEKSEISAHGFRAMARTLLHEVLQFSPDAIEAQLAHSVPDRLGRAYNRTTHLPERKKMMQVWADYLDKLKTNTKVVPIRAKTL